jgi:hypothetical protein
MGTDRAREDGGAEGRKSEGSMAMKSLFRLFGPLMFLCGITLLFLERAPLIARVLGGGKVELAERGVGAIIIVILSFAIMTISKSHAEIEKKLDVLSQMPEFFKRQERRLETATLETNILRSLAKIYYKTPPDRIHLLAGINVLQEMHKLNVHGNFKSMEGLGEKRAQSASLKDRSIAFLFLKELLELLPSGGVWFGVTHLTSPKVWRGKQLSEDFNNYRGNMWTRATAGDIRVFRIYYFSNAHDFHQMSTVLEDERNNGVLVRYMIGGQPPPDMSLLWSPAAPSKRSHLELDGITSHSNIEAMKSRGFLPICGIKFDVRSHEQLNDVEVNDPDSDEFRTLLRKFTEAWSKDSKPWPVPEGVTSIDEK